MIHFSRFRPSPRLLDSCAAAGLAILLAGCVTPDEQRAINMANDNRQCRQMGFVEGSQALAECMGTAAATRDAEADRQAAANRAWQAKRDEDWRRMTQRNAPDAGRREDKPAQNCDTVESTTTRGDGTVVTKTRQRCSSF